MIIDKVYLVHKMYEFIKMLTEKKARKALYEMAIKQLLPF